MAERHRHTLVQQTLPQRQTRERSGLPVLYDYCPVCGCIPTNFLAETPKLLEIARA